MILSLYIHDLFSYLFKDCKCCNKSAPAAKWFPTAKTLFFLESPVKLKGHINYWSYNFARPIKHLTCSWTEVLGWRLQFRSLIYLWRHISFGKMYLWGPLNLIHIRLVSPQLCCGDTCQVWTWYITVKQCFAISKSGENYRMQAIGLDSPPEDYKSCNLHGYSNPPLVHWPRALILRTSCHVIGRQSCNTVQDNGQHGKHEHILPMTSWLHCIIMLISVK